jgi:hypothetical protein
MGRRLVGWSRLKSLTMNRSHLTFVAICDKPDDPDAK